MTTLVYVHCCGTDLDIALVRLQPRATRPGGAPPAPPPHPHAHGRGLLRSLEARALTGTASTAAGVSKGLFRWDIEGLKAPRLAVQLPAGKAPEEGARVPRAPPTLLLGARA